MLRQACSGRSACRLPTAVKTYWKTHLHVCRSEAAVVQGHNAQHMVRIQSSLRTLDAPQARLKPLLEAQEQRLASLLASKCHTGQQSAAPSW